MTQTELDRINVERKKRGLPPLTLTQAASAMLTKKADDGDNFNNDFLISYMTGIPMPSAGGIIGAAVSPTHYETPSYSPPPSYDPPASDSGSSFDSGAGGGGGGDW